MNKINPNFKRWTIKEVCCPPSVASDTKSFHQTTAEAITTTTLDAPTQPRDPVRPRIKEGTKHPTASAVRELHGLGPGT